MNLIHARHFARMRHPFVESSLMIMNTLPRLWRRSNGVIPGHAQREPVTRAAAGLFAACVTWLPVGSFTVALGLYGLASWSYPASEWDGTGYDHVRQYWCDLLRETSPSGAVNAGRDYALVATCLLPLSLVPLWFKVPALLNPERWPVRLVPLAGTLAMSSLALVGTGAHDQVLHVGALMGSCAMAVVLTSLDASRHPLATSSARLAAGLAVINYVLWVTGMYPLATPLSQKAALLAAAVWVVTTCSAISRVEQSARSS